MKSKMFCHALAAGSLLIATTPVFAVQVPNVFQSGEAALASEVNQNFQTLADAINNVTNTGGNTGNAAFSDAYSMPPSSSSDKAMRNVVVLAAEVHDQNGDPIGTCYRVRVNFANDTGAIQVDKASGSVTPDEVEIIGKACKYNSGLFVYPWANTYGLVNGGGDATEIDADRNFDGTLEVHESYDYRLVAHSNPLDSAELVNATETFSDNTGVVAAQSYSSIWSAFGQSLTMNGLTFADVAVQNYTSVNRTRFDVRGVGTVMQVDNGTFFAGPVFSRQTTVYKAIFYRIEGKGTNGNLAGTPFAAGEAAYGKWFTP